MVVLDVRRRPVGTCPWVVQPCRALLSLGSIMPRLSLQVLAPLLLLVPVGLLATTILTVNNLRDIETDRQADKLTLAVYMGVRGTKMEYVLLLLGAFAVPLAMWRLGVVGPAVLLSWVTIPYSVKLAVDVWSKQGADLNRVLAQTAQLGLMYALFFSVGLLL